jgi:hypothetical protein
MEVNKTKHFLIIFSSTIAIGCLLGNKKMESIRKLEIIKTDTTSEFYVFKTMSEAGSEVIVIAEKEKVNSCKPFKKFIVADSVHETSIIKSGSGYDFVGMYLSYIDNIQIRKKGELVKIIWNCQSFTEK